ncbi:MAG TPA: J domain-containing protein [Clostridia bacterium]
MSGKDPYETLGVRRGASQEQIKKAYRDMVKKYHPDKYKDHPLEDLAKEKMQEINEAYELLTRGDGNGGPYTGYASPEDAAQQARRGGYGAGPGGPQGPFAQGPFYTQRTGNTGANLCDSLSCLCCADSCCECAGGDLCGCC